MNNISKQERDSIHTAIFNGVGGDTSQIIKNIPPDKLEWIRKNDPELYNRLQTGEAKPIRVYSPRELNPGIMNPNANGMGTVSTVVPGGAGEALSQPNGVSDTPVPPAIVEEVIKKKGNRKMQKRANYVDLKAALIILLLELYKGAKEPAHKKEIRSIIVELKDLYPRIKKHNGNKINMFKAVGIMQKRGWPKNKIHKRVRKSVLTGLGIGVIGAGVGAVASHVYTQKKLKKEKVKILRAIKTIKSLMRRMTRE